MELTPWRIGQLVGVLWIGHKTNTNLFYRAVITVAGIGGFVFAKNLIDKQRYEAMKVRERMKAAPRGPL